MTDHTTPWPSIDRLRARLRRRRGGAVDLLDRSLAGIASVDPSVNAVFAADPAARARAEDSDRRYAAGTERPLEGIPVLIKDNIDTAGLATAAGSPLLAGAPPRADAAVVALLRAAGAVVVGKSNLSEWGDFRSTRGIEGWSGAGGQTRNPHALDHSPAGSSSGSAAAVAASMTPVAIGTETDGSVVCPASVTGVVGVKPALGVLPSSGIVPVSPALDTPGVLAGTTADAAAVLTALTGGRGTAVPPLGGLRLAAWPGRRMGPAALDALDRAATALTAAGAVVIPVELPLDEAMLNAALDTLVAEFRPGLETYLAGRQGVPDTLAELIEANEAWPAPFGQDLFVRALEAGDSRRGEARGQRARIRRWARGVLRDALTRTSASAVIAPTSDPAWPLDHAAGDGGARNTSTLPALAGLPHVTVPTGLYGGLPVGLSVFGPDGTFDAMAVATAVEAVCGPRPLPRLLDRPDSRPPAVPSTHLPTTS
ncbi:amidase family protein [Streptomyces sp. NPDC127113]|uniref:amidase family protein n=1 Tax=unclassified Streptomyces TaxID=2593676 RepID=UPI00362C1E3B